MIVDKNQRPTKLLWLDMEMTGLDPQKDVILEIVAKVTDYEFQELDTFQSIVSWPESILAEVNDWSREHHTASGLLERVRKEGQSPADVELTLIAFINKHFKGELAILAGNSIHFDRTYIRRQWPAVDQLLDHRMLDVTAWKIIMLGKYDVVFDKKERHRALDDIDESIDQLKYYLAWLKGNPGKI